MDHLVVQQGIDLVLFTLDGHAHFVGTEFPVACQRLATAAFQLQVGHIRIAGDAAAAAIVNDAYRDSVHPCPQGLRRHGILPRCAPLLGHATYPLAIHPDLVTVINRTQCKHCALSRFRFCQGERGAVPGDAIHAGPAVVFPGTRHTDHRPVTVIVIGQVPLRFVVATLLPALQLALYFLHQVLVSLQHFLHALRQPFLVDTERGRTHPGLDIAAAPGAVDDADRHAGGSAQFAGEGVAHRREIGHGLRRSCHPATTHQIMLRLFRPGFRNLEVTDLRVARGSNHCVDIIGTGDRPFHVRLPRCQPHIPYQQVAHIAGAVSGTHGQLIRTAGALRRQRCRPAAVSTSRHVNGTAIEIHMHRRTGIRRAPDAQGLVTLQYGAIRKQARQLHFRLRHACEQQQYQRKQTRSSQLQLHFGSP